jgi:hypothetical protein
MGQRGDGLACFWLKAIQQECVEYWR